ncbi:hypothetical protein [Priestia megaterium]|uniref:hypothetical protein n=1 Tax=Priestia megaterium TaxID=1404 RepID=UPI0013E40431|nr:hypothetical protein [Priestia megaterium]MED3866045.1 hypothetical protein [Priestia megaterium]MED4101700.1 hypothetical protein [Priestia megaterium]MED4145713.1 hypothetical protein [Priestia megaterium]MED4166442.1 hypothetical protein [Priestia megaterium]MED4199632.1 hypothetical protein [Priestia megaterium]
MMDFRAFLHLQALKSAGVESICLIAKYQLKQRKELGSKRIEPHLLHPMKSISSKM